MYLRLSKVYAKWRKWSLAKSRHRKTRVDKVINTALLAYNPCTGTQEQE